MTDRKVMDTDTALCPICKKEVKVKNFKKIDDGGKYTFDCGHLLICITKTDVLTINDSLRARLKRQGYKKFAYELLTGWFPSHKFVKGVFQNRVVDKITNWYSHLIRVDETGVIDHCENEKLTEHFLKKGKKIHNKKRGLRL